MSSKFNEEKTIAMLYANFSDERKKANDWIFIAKKFKELTEYYGSHKEVAKKIGISNEQGREILKLLDLDKNVQDLVKNGKLKFEVAWRMSSIRKPSDQNKIAKLIKDLNMHDARDVVRVFKNNPKIDIENYVEKIKANKKKFENINLVIVPLKEIDYLYIKKISSRMNKSPEKIISEVIIPEWLEAKSK